MQASRFACLAALCAAALSLSGAARAPHRPRAEQIAPNDNPHGAGHLAKGVLTVSLEARLGEWHPEESGGPRIPVEAFSVAGAPLQTPGPLLRAPVGTEIRVTMHNALATPMWVYGLGEHRGFEDSVEVPAGDTREMHFRATSPGLSYYAGRTLRGPVQARTTDDSQLNGAIVIDPPGATPGDRIFVDLGLGDLRFDDGERPRSQCDAGLQRARVAAFGTHRSRAGRHDALALHQCDRSAASVAYARLLLSGRCEG